MRFGQIHQYAASPPAGPVLQAAALPLDRRDLEHAVPEGLRPVGAVVELLHERGMDDRDVVPLEIVVHVDLPVAVERPLAPEREAHRAEPAFREADVEVVQRRGERRSTGIEVHEDEPDPRRPPRIRAGARPPGGNPRRPRTRASRGAGRPGRRSSRGSRTSGRGRSPRPRRPARRGGGTRSKGRGARRPSPRTTRSSSSATRAVKKSPGRATRSARPTSCHEAPKTKAFSAARTAGSVYSGAGSVAALASRSSTEKSIGADSKVSPRTLPRL